MLTEGQTNDHVGAKLIYENLPSSASHLIGDKGYDSDEFCTALEAKGIKACIPPRRNRAAKTGYCKALYKTRHNSISINES